MNIQRLPLSRPTADAVPVLLDHAGITPTAVSNVNWSAYPYLPTAQVRMALADDALLIHYHVEEQAVLARYAHDGDAVWTDSCMECFLLGSDAHTYYNIECSCIGTLLIGRGEGRTGRTPLSPALLATADRWSSLGRVPFGLINKPTHWDLALVLPFTLFGSDSEIFNAPTLKGNIYKCGDDLPTPHFVTLFPIPIKDPDFHRPDHFGTFTIG